MPYPKEYMYNANAKYSVPTTSFNNTLNFKDNLPDLLSNLVIYVSDKEFFQTKLENIFTNTIITFKKESEVTRWRAKCDMNFWEHQLNFSCWCATSGCGIAVLDHLSNENTLAFVRSFFRFHVYYTVRKILQEMRCPLPTDDSFKENNNNIDLTLFNRISNEFNVSVDADYRFKAGKNSGMGIPYVKWGPEGIKEFSNYNSNPYVKFDSPDSDHYVDHMENILAKNSFAYFIAEKGQGFTRPGIERINDSIRTYIYCILGSQAQVRSPIIENSASAFDAQKQFVFLVEDSIHGKGASISIPDSIERYQSAISQTRSKLVYAIGPNLYLLPSDMILKMGSIENFNNNIKVATNDMSFGVNDINQEKHLSGKLIMEGGKPIINRVDTRQKNKISVEKEKEIIQSPTPITQSKGVNHNDFKIYLTVGLSASFALLYYYFKN